MLKAVASIGSNTGDVTLAGENYLSLVGQVLTAHPIDLSGSNATGILAAARFPALTGDITTASGALATTLATVNANVGNFGSSTSIPSFTVNGKGLVTAAGSNVVIAPAGTLSGTTLNSTVVTSSLTTIGTLVAGSVPFSLVTGTVPVNQGGTGQSSYTDGQLLIGNTATGLLSKNTITAGSNITITNGNGTITISSAAPGTGTVTSVSVVTANGVSASVANPTTTPAITLTLGAITPSSVNASGTVLGSNLSGTNTGDQTITLTGAVTGSGTGSFATTIQSSIALPGSPTTTTQASNDNSTKIATTAYVTTGINNAIAGVNPAVAVQAATTQASDTSSLTYNNGVSGIGATFTGSNNTAFTVDGFTFTALNQRVLIKNDTQSPSGAFNGVYYVSQIQTAILPPILTRALDYDTPSDINNTGAIPVVNGTLNALTSWLLTSSITTVGTDPLTYSKFSINPGSTVTAVSVASANGFAGSSGGGTTPILTLSTSITGFLYGNGTAMSAATISTGLTASTSTLKAISAFISDTFAYSHAGGV